MKKTSKTLSKRINFVNTENQAKNRASDKSQYSAFDCDCGTSFAVETKTSIWVACGACRVKNTWNPKNRKTIL